MKKIVLLLTIMALLGTLLIQPVAFAEVAQKDAYSEINVLGFGGSDTTGYNDYCGWRSKNYKVASDKNSGGRSVVFGSTNSLAARNISFGGSVPRSIVINMDLRKDCGYFGNSNGSRIRIYAFPYGTKITTVSGGAVTAFTLPNTEESLTDASSYLIVDQRHDPRWEREYGANDFVKYEYALNGNNLDRLKTGTWDVVITGGHGAAFVSGNGNSTMVLDSFYFNKDNLGAYNVQDALYNSSVQKGWPEQPNTGALATNSYEKDGEDLIKESYVEFGDVDFGSESQDQLAAVITYSSKDGGYARGNLIIELKDGENWVEYGRVKVVSTGNTDHIYTTNHRVLLNKNLSGVHDIRVTADSNYFVRLFNIRFERIDDLSKVYGNVSCEINGDGDYNVTLPVNMDYVKENAKVIVGIYDANKNLISIKTPADYSVDTAVIKATTAGENVARNDSGWKNVTIVVPEEEVTAIGGFAGKTIRAFLWEDLETITPITPVSELPYD